MWHNKIRSLRYDAKRDDHYDTTHCGTIHCDTIYYNMKQLDTIVTMWYIATRYDALRYDTLQYDTIQYSMILLLIPSRDTQVLLCHCIPSNPLQASAVLACVWSYGTWAQRSWGNFNHIAIKFNEVQENPTAQKKTTHPHVHGSAVQGWVYSWVRGQ